MRGRADGVAGLLAHACRARVPCLLKTPAWRATCRCARRPTTLPPTNARFAVLDNRFLLNGSFNWTCSAVLENEAGTRSTGVSAGAGASIVTRLGRMTAVRLRAPSERERDYAVAVRRGVG